MTATAAYSRRLQFLGQELPGLPAYRLARAPRLFVTQGDSAVEVERVAGQEADQVEGQRHFERVPVGLQASMQLTTNWAATEETQSRG